MSMLSDVYQEYLERERVVKAALSASEERERVLRDALGNLVAALKLGGYMKRGHFYYYGVADPAMTKPFNDACALATPAPEQPEEEVSE